MDQLTYFQSKLQFETDAEDLRAALDNGADIVVVDTRSVAAYTFEHIPGAISFPHSDMTECSTASLDRGRVYVTYGDGVGSNAATKGAFKLASFGFTVKEFAGGLEWWSRRGFRTEGSFGVVARAVN